MTTSLTAVDALKSKLYDLNAIHAAMSMMDWDQQVNMPEGGAEARAEHQSILTRMAHELLVDEGLRTLVDRVANEVDPNDLDTAALVRVTRREIDRATKIPAELVSEKAKLAALAHDQWVRARAENDFKSFAPVLSRMFEIAGEEAEHLGYEGHIYNALLNQYEEGATVDDCNRMYDALKAENKSLIDAITASNNQPDDSGLYGEWDIAAQKAFTEKIVKEIGFDFERGRQDVAPHPFCTGWSVGDIRLTTRYKSYIGSAIFGSLHEAGHGMYEQGSPKHYDRLPICGGASLGVHESQSRLWENIVGRSRAFWSRYLPELQKSFPALASFSLDTWYRAINKVEPSFIRVEADEVTYNMHTLVRYEIECEVLTGKLKVTDMPEAWNSKYEAYLGIRPNTDSEGCLQDVHWSGGSIGYFPTYSMGNCLSFQIWACIKRDLGDVDAMMAAGEFAPILNWLIDNVYVHGQKFTPKELVIRVTGKPMGAEDYLSGLRAKYSEIYNLS